MRLLQAALSDVLTEEELKSLYTSFDLIGDIVIIKIPDELLEKKQLIAQAVLERLKNVRTVLRQTTPVDGEYRIRGLEWVGGERKTETIYKEHGCRFKVDLSKVYFSPRLSTERLRIASQVKAGELVVNMFGGVGTFSIIIAKKQPSSINYTIDINPLAHQLAIENVKLNKVEDKVIPILGDARDVIRSSLKGKADRVLMPLPEKASDYLDDAILTLKDGGGIVHYYTHIDGRDRADAVKKAEIGLEKNLSKRYQILHSRVVREVGPRWYQVVLDIELLSR